MTFQSKTVAGFGIALVILIFVCGYSYFNITRSAEDRSSVTHTHLVLEKLDEVQANLTDAETGQRGYIITGEEAYLQPYNDALGHIRKNLKELRYLTADNRTQQDTLGVLEPIIGMKLNVLQNCINIRSKFGMKAAVEAVREGSGKSYMDEVRKQLARMRLEERRLLKERSEEAEASSHKTKVILLLGDLLALSFLCIAGAIVRQEVEHRRHAEEGVRLLNADLERRVDERTAELDQRAKDLARSNSELQQFAYVASHDLQEPLRMVASFTQLLGKRYKDKLDDDARDFISYAVDGATRMQTLISDLLSYSRVGTQSKALESTPCDAVLDRVLFNLKFVIEETGTVIVRDPLPDVMADALQMGQLFQNLIANAIKFRRKDAPRIHISSEWSGGEWKISVGDNGIGISTEHAERIFVIFQRLHTKTEYPGTGIGLAVCKKIVERHGGRIWVEPNARKGSTFCFTLPPAPKAQGEQENEQHELRIPVTSD